EYLEWQNDTKKLFSEMAWYRPTSKNVELAHDGSVRLAIGLASANFFRVLRVPIPDQGPHAGSQPLLVLSRSASRALDRTLDGIAGQSAKIDGTSVRIAVLDEDDARLPDTMQAWMLEDQTDLEQLSP